jgi:hypothetical protein
MNKYLVFLKNPKIWFGIILFIGIIVSIILIIKALKPTPLPETKLCEEDQTKITCSDGSIKCAPICPIIDMSWDCVSGKCQCKSGNLCGDQCCTTCNTKLNVCCPDSQAYTDSTGRTECCQAGTKANKDHTGCVDSCGTLDCKEDELCINIEGIIDSEATKNSLKKASIPYDDTTEPTIIKYCSKPVDCRFKDETAEPSAIDSNYFFHNFSKNGLDTDSSNGLNACFPTDGGSNENCYLQMNKQVCEQTTGCTWLDLLDDFGNDAKAFSDRIAARNKHFKRSTFGDYCSVGGDVHGNRDVYGRYVQFKEQDREKACTVADCIRQVSNNNTVQVGWNETTRTCSALRIPGNNGMKVKCFNSQGVVDCGDQPEEQTTDWTFKACNDEAIFRYKDDDGNTTCNNCGNCPFGDNSNSYTDDITGQKYGTIDDGGLGIACYDNGEIKTPSTGLKWIIKDYVARDSCRQMIDDSDPGWDSPYASAIKCTSSNCKGGDSDCYCIGDCFFYHSWQPLCYSIHDDPKCLPHVDKQSCKQIPGCIWEWAGPGCFDGDGKNENCHLLTNEQVCEQAGCTWFIA